MRILAIRQQRIHPFQGYGQQLGGRPQAQVGPMGKKFFFGHQPGVGHQAPSPVGSILQVDSTAGQCLVPQGALHVDELVANRRHRAWLETWYRFPSASEPSP